MYYLDEKYIKAWQRKPLLRHIYTDFHTRISKQMVPGKTLEIGSGISQFKYDVNLDIKFGAADVIADAHQLPFAEKSFDNIVMVDVLHHLEYPLAFIGNAQRMLKENGRLIMIEPAITPLSYLFYKLFHDEPVKMNWKYLLHNPKKANQAIATLFTRHSHTLTVQWFSFFAYPLSGGYRRWSLLPSRIGAAILHLERWLEPVGRYFAFRMLIVINAA